MSSPWYARYPGDYLRDTAHLSLIEHGAYGLLLDHYYSTGSPLPSRKEALYRVCKAFTDAERAAVDSVLGQFFKLRTEGYRNARADREIAIRREHNRKLSEAGRRGGQARLKPGFKPGLSKPQPQPQPQPEEKSSSAAAAFNPDSVFKHLGISPCGPPAFRIELERAWASRNGDQPSELIGRVVDDWEDKHGTKDRGRFRPLFRALSQMRATESKSNVGGLNGTNHAGTDNRNRPAHGFFGEPERDWVVKVTSVPNS